MSRYYKMDVRGKNWLQRVNGKDAWAAGDEGRILYDEADNTVYVGGAAAWIESGSHSDVPATTILLIESDVVIAGYTLLTDQDDMVVYITQGSPGGAAAGTNQGTETFPNHAHSQLDHVHTLNSHTHTTGNATVPGAAAHTHPPQAGVADFMSSTGSTHGRAGDSYGVYANTGANVAGATNHNHGATGGPSTADSGSSGGDNTLNQTAAINWASWKPSGRNFTRQQRT